MTIAIARSSTPRLFITKQLAHRRLPLKARHARPQPCTKSEVPAVSLAHARRHTVALDSDSEDDCCGGNDTSSSLLFRHVPTQPQQRRIHFSPHCTVVSIPHYRDYSPTQQAQLWNGRKHIRRNAKRNTLEYQYDGWNWETATEEDGFVSDPAGSGNTVHPWHVAKKQQEQKAAARD